MTRALQGTIETLNKNFLPSPFTKNQLRYMSRSNDTFQSRAEDTRNIATTSSPSRPVPYEFSRQAPYRQDSYDPFSHRSYERHQSTQGGVAPVPHFQHQPVPLGEPASIRPLVHHDTPILLSNDQNSMQDEPLPRSAMVNVSSSTRRYSAESYENRSDSPSSQSYPEYENEPHRRRGTDVAPAQGRYQSRRRPYNQDEFDGPSQLLPLPLPDQEYARSQPLLNLPVGLELKEQDQILLKAHDILSACAYHFIAKYQFPIPVERDKPRVRSPSDRDWTEWAYLLKRLATKRRIPARVLYDNQIKQLVTTLENSVAARQSTNKGRQTPREPRDDRYILQLISAGTQVAKILMDSLAMQELDTLYSQTEAVIFDRRRMSRTVPSSF